MLTFFAAWYNWPFLLSAMVGGASDDHVGHDHADFGDGDHGVEGVGWLAWLGAGKVPAGLLLQVLLLAFGFGGLLVNALAWDLAGPLANFAFPVALVVASTAAIAITRGSAALLGRLAPAKAIGTRGGDLIGSFGVTASSVTGHIGQVRVEREGHPAALVNACLSGDNTATANGSGELPRGIDVQVVGYDPRRKLYVIVPLPALE